MVTVAKAEQLLKASEPMEVTKQGISTEVS
jgi:hypothetical protein